MGDAEIASKSHGATEIAGLRLPHGRIPVVAYQREKVGGFLAIFCGVIVSRRPGCADQNLVATDRHRRSKIPIGSGITGEEFLLLNPDAIETAPLKDISRPVVCPRQFVA